MAVAKAPWPAIKVHTPPHRPRQWEPFQFIGATPTIAWLGRVLAGCGCVLQRCAVLPASAPSGRLDSPLLTRNSKRKAEKRNFQILQGCRYSFADDLPIKQIWSKFLFLEPQATSVAPSPEPSLSAATKSSDRLATSPRMARRSSNRRVSLADR